MNVHPQVRDESGRLLMPSERLLWMIKELQRMYGREDHPVQRGLLLSAAEILKQSWMIECDREQRAEKRMRENISKRLEGR